MSVFQNSSGLHGKLTVDIDGGGTDTTVGGISEFSISANGRNRIPIPTHFGDDRDEEVIGTKQIIEITWSGTFDTTLDTGQNDLRNAFDAELELEEGRIKFFLWSKDGVETYWTPSPGDHIRIVSVDETSQSADGFATYAGSAVVIGDLQLVTNVS